MGSTISSRKKLIPVEAIKTVKKVNINDVQKNIKNPNFAERRNLHNFGYRVKSGLLEVTVSGISISGGYKEIEFYKGKSKLPNIAVKGIKENGKCDFTTESMDGIVEDVDDVEFFELAHGGIISIAKKGVITMLFRNRIEPIISRENSRIRVYTCNTDISGKIRSPLVVAIKEGNREPEFFIDGKRVEKEYNGAR